ncbi:MAG: DUF2264 domain-containing protein [Candidatus Latescibacteria bacterium]|nr:DUF2264 domain-containing protein [Candidatus Latescibacterota bacterium]
MIKNVIQSAKNLGEIPRRHLLQLRRFRHRKVPWTSDDARVKEIFLNDALPEQERYRELFLYFVRGFLYYRAPDKAHVYYPGASSRHDASIDAMEGFCRMLPMIAAWIKSGREHVIQNIDGEPVDLIEVARDGILSGTDPKSKGFWGHIQDFEQRMVEAVNVALSIWLLRDFVWYSLSSAEKKRIADWLLEINGKEVWDNNWHLFPVMINVVLRSLDFPYDQKSVNKHYDRLKSFYQDNGWFRDGLSGEYDYYNAWGIHYALFWLNEINPEFDPEFIRCSQTDFIRTYKYLISTEGIPITGRSICYRMAVPAPLVTGAINGLDRISPGLARRALDCVWSYFIGKDALSKGTATQGYWQEDIRLLDNYSGPGSSLWSLRSLIPAFYTPPDSDFWAAPLEKLPIERESYEVPIPEIGWIIKGNKETQEVVIIKENNAGNAFRSLQKQTFRRKLKQVILCKASRHPNGYVKYKLHEYSSLWPFWVEEEVNISGELKDHY